MADNKLYALIDYEDSYVQPLLLKALNACLPPELLVLIRDLKEIPTPESKVLQWRQYESIDWDVLSQNPTTSLANSYMIRKALIRKNFLSVTVSQWLSKSPDSALGKHVMPTVEFEVDYAEFLDDALLEAYELKESWERNASNELAERQWWILKPGMSERGQGIRLFSSEEELTHIFEAWDPPSDDEDDEGGPDNTAEASEYDPAKNQSTAIMTSHLRHFVAQPYIHPPLLFPPPHSSSNRKFHIRTYVLAVGALRLYVYKSMLALFAAQAYQPPDSTTANTPESLTAHLTNTCLQSGTRLGSVATFASLPSSLPDLPTNWKDSVFEQICTTSAEIFTAAARTMSVHFQPLPNGFEIFGLDFLVDAEGTAWLLEVNAFPDFAQTGAELQGVVEELMEGVVLCGILPFFGLRGKEEQEEKVGNMAKELDLDLGRR